MLPTRLALKILASVLSDAAWLTERSRREATQRTSRLRQAARDLLAKADSHRKGLPEDCDPAVLGYLCCYARSHAPAMPALIEYLSHRQDPRADRIRTANWGDRAATIFVALGVAD
jgi:hypothetical protein